MIAAPNDGDVHLEVLSRLMTILMDDDFRDDLLKAKDADEFLKVIDDMEKEKYPDEPAAEERSENGYKVLAVTACPTGIAHTYMAEEKWHISMSKKLHSYFTIYIIEWNSIILIEKYFCYSCSLSIIELLIVSSYLTLIP